MSEIYVGTAYNQIYCVSLCPKTPIQKIGQKKRAAITSIFLPNQSNLQPFTVKTEQVIYNTLYYSNQTEMFKTNRIQSLQENNQFSEIMPFCINQDPAKRQRLLAYEKFNLKKIYFTNHGNMYYNEEQPAENWHKLYYNEIYHDRISSLPKQGVGRLLPQYTCVRSFYQSDHLQVAFAGRGLVPFVYETTPTLASVTWKAKNPTNDELDLEVPIEDVDLCFLKMGCHLACLHAQNRIRVYDVKSRRRKAILDVALTEVEKADNKCKLTKMCVSKCENLFYVGNVRGSIYELDARKNFSIVGKFKGITTTIKDMQISQGKLVVISMDGYLRIFNIATKQKQFERYLNTQPEVLKLTDEGVVYPSEETYQIQEIDLREKVGKKGEKGQGEAEEGDEEEQKVKKVKKIRKRNKVGLKYIRQAKFDEVKLEQIQLQEEQAIKQEERRKLQYEDEDLDL